MVDYTLFDGMRIFKDCTPEEKKQAARCCTRVYFKKNEQIYLEGEKADAVYIILKGIVELCKFHEDEGRKVCIGLLPAGDIFGIGEVYFNEYYINAISITQSTLVRLEKELFFSVFMEIPSLRDFVVTAFAKIIRQNTLMLDWFSARNMFTYFLFHICKEYGQEKRSCILVGKHLTHDRISEVLNLSRVHVSRLFKQFRDEKIILNSGLSLEIDRAWFEAKKEDPYFSLNFKRKFCIAFEL